MAAVLAFIALHLEASGIGPRVFVVVQLCAQLFSLTDNSPLDFVQSIAHTFG